MRMFSFSFFAVCRLHRWQSHPQGGKTARTWGDWSNWSDCLMVDQLGEWGRVQLARACRQQHLCSSSNAMETQGSLVSPWGCAQLPIFSPSREYSCSHGAWPTRVSRQTTIILLPSWGRTPGRHCCGRERRLPSWGRTPGRHCCGRERSRKLRWVSSYTLYRMDPENTLYRMCTRGNQYVVYRRTHSIRLHDM